MEQLETGHIYVNAIDKALSGWGLAKGGKSRVSFRCTTQEQADACIQTLEARPDMIRITTSKSPPKLKEGDHLTTVDIKDAAEGVKT